MCKIMLFPVTTNAYDDAAIGAIELDNVTLGLIESVQEWGIKTKAAGGFYTVFECYFTVYDYDCIPFYWQENIVDNMEYAHELFFTSNKHVLNWEARPTSTHTIRSFGNDEISFDCYDKHGSAKHSSIRIDISTIKENAK